ncbi:MAG: glycoside hydrolase family 16 protein [Rubrivivax sp.]|nr:glycoside hydrolase family 16 protein [Rubrivivax sp.]
MTDPRQGAARTASHWAWMLALSLGACACGGGGGAQTLAVVPATPASAPPAPVADGTAVPAGYELVWADEFEAAGLPDGANWVHDTGRNRDGWYNNELQYYAAQRPENAVVRDGRLVITARREDLSSAPDWGGQHYTSARLITRGKVAWTYGFFEVRARVPCGQGTWSAIWTLGAGGRWPQDGELDILEHVGSNPSRVFSTVHTQSGSGGNGSGSATQLPDACTAFHNYQMTWTADAIDFGVDGVVHHRYRNPGTGSASWPFDAPQFMILNVAVGGDLGGFVDDRIFPAVMEVEYARVYQARR